MASFDLSGPALAPPDGITPNFDEPPNGNGIASASLILMVAISTLCILLRAYGKMYLAKKINTEDILILLAYGNYWGCSWASYSLVHSPGYFVHNWDLVLGETILPYYYIFVFGVFYSVNLALLKIAILVEWCRVFVPLGARRSSYFWWVSLMIIILQTAFGVAAIFLLNFQCLPHEAIWDFTITNKTCIPLNPLQILSATIHLFSDVVIFLLPQKIIWSLNMSVQKRLGVAVVFSLGALAVICSIFRLKATIDFGQSPDTLYNIGPVILWATGEMTCGFFVACMPILPRVLKESIWMGKIRRRLGLKLSSTSSSEKAKGSGYGIGGGAASHKMSRSTMSHDAYLQLDEDGIPMNGLQASASTEHLRHGKNDDNIGRITRTTLIVVSRDQHPGSDLSGNSTLRSKGV